MKKQFLDNQYIKKGNKIRFDIKAQAIFKTTEDFQLNQEFKWITIDIFKKFEKDILINKNKDLNES